MTTAIDLLNDLKRERMTPAQRQSELHSNLLAFGLWALMIGGFLVCLVSSVSLFAGGPNVPMLSA